MKIKVLFLFIFVFVQYLPSKCFSEEYKNLQFIDVNNPFINKIPVAIPEFIPLEKNEKILEITESSNDYLGYLLNFTSYFRVSDSGLKVDDIVGTKIDFLSWKKQGFEYLITAGLFMIKIQAFLTWSFVFMMF